MYKLSVIIPTRNRAEYCLAAIKSVENLNDDKIQIVIQDNSDDDSLRQKIVDMGNSNIKYNYHEGILSFVDNFSEAIENADGEYLCMIGDDDAVLPEIICAVELMEKDSLDGLVPGLNSVYLWPCETPLTKNGENGYLCLAYIKNKYQMINPISGLEKLMETAGQRYQELDLPRLYHGIVKKDVVKKVKKTTGYYFGGLTPDIYMSAALAMVCEKAARIDYPITVSGICPRSGSADSATGRHTGQLKDAPHFRGHTNYTWDKKCPSIYSVESIWAETVLHAVLDFGRTDLYDKFNIARLDAQCYKKYPQFKNEILCHAKNYGIKRGYIIADTAYITVSQYFNKIIHRVFRKKGDVIKLYNVTDIFKAVTLTMKNIEKVVYNNR